MTTLPENRPVAIDGLESAITEMESHLEAVNAERDEAKARQVELEIENANLRRELNLAREQQKAAAGILSVISSSVADTKPVFESILSSIKHLFDGEESLIFLTDKEGLLRIVAARGASAEAARERFPIPVEGTASELAIRERRLVRSDDVQNDPDVPIKLREIARRVGQNYSMAIAPMLWEGNAIGTIFVGRSSMVPFTDRECELLNSFADQAVIAIQNVRLFNETREALERQTATAEILRVIASSPSDVLPVFEAIVGSAKRLLGGFSAAVFRFFEEIVHLEAITPTNPAADEIMKNSFPRPIADFQSFAMVQTGRTVQTPDIEVLSDDIRDIARARGFRSMLLTPLLREGTPIGLISVTRVEPGPFAAHSVQLLQTFADQAVIAIENTRLFNETKEALEQQKASSDILRVISSSVADAQPVFDKILVSCKHLFGSDETAVLLLDGEDTITLGAYVGKQHDAVAASFPAPLDKSPAGRAIREGHAVHYTDVANDPQLTHTVRRVAQLAGYESMAYAPMVSNGRGIGAIGASRNKGRFSDKELLLLQTFADQAVIAIENTRLFNEVQARTEDLSESLRQQTAVGDVLKTISRATFELQPVLDTLVNSAAQLCDADMAFIMRRVGDEYRAGAAVGYTEAYIDFLNNHPLRVDRGTVTGRAVLERHPVQIVDVAADPEYTLHETTTLAGQRTTLGVPLLRESEPIGVIVLARKRVEAFTDKQIELVATFADQAVIAIENVRLFKEVQQRTEDLSEALQQQTATADVLKLISRSAFDLQSVLNTLTESAARLCNADMGAIALRDERGFYHATNYNFSVDWIRVTDNLRLQPGRGSLIGRTLLARTAVQIEDVLADTEYQFPEMQKAAGYRSLLGVPLMRGGEPIGVLFLGRKIVESYSDKQIDLVSTFADQAVIAIENVRLFDEVQAKTRDLEESLQQQTATADVLKVISRSAFDLQTVLDALLSSACRLCEADIATIRYRDRDDGDFRLAATFGAKPEWVEQFARHSRKPGRESIFGRTIVDGHTVHIPDVLADPELQRSEAQKLMGFRAALGVPLTREGQAFGVITLFRFAVGSFEERQIELVQTFADQAVIAIENVRLFDEVQAKKRDLEEALTYQTGSANILSVIAASPTDVEPVLQAIVESACDLCEAYDCIAFLRDGDYLRFSAHHGPIPMDFDRWPINRKWVTGRSVVDKRPVHVHDLMAEGDEFPDGREMSARMGHRTMVAVPLLRDGNAIGSIILRRNEVNPFSDKQVNLLQTFADQAVIAIGNVRLFEEVQAKTRDLEEALTYQTGSANILKVIASSPTDINPVFHAIVESACELCNAYDAVLRLKSGDNLSFSAHHGPISTFRNERPINRYWTAGRAILEQRPVQIDDILSAEGEQFPEARELAMRQGHRTILSVPLLREGESLGTITLRRTEVHPFSEKQITLLQTFADQAVIAIGNVRLFEEVQAKTRDLEQALTYQTGSADILKVIASSPTDVGPVLHSIVENACSLCDADDAIVFLEDAGELRSAAHHGPIPEGVVKLPIAPTRVVGTAFIQQRPVHVRDFHSAEGDEFPHGKELALRFGHRTMLAVPLLREGQSIGVITLRRNEVEPFAEKQIALLQTFADQAVIAIGNVRLFEEVQAKTRDLEQALTYQTGSANILKVIASSPTNVGPVLNAIVESACELCQANDAIVFLREGDRLSFKAHHGQIPVVFGENRTINRGYVAGRSMIDKVPIHVTDIFSEEAADLPEARELSHSEGIRSILGVPMLRENESVGAILLRRTEVHPFSDEQIALLQTFADQAVIAIGNVRLFEQVQERTRELSKSLDDLRTAQDRLVQTEKLASLGQLTAGIAHEIKNPLNFVNNFAALSTELTEELKDALKQAEVSEKIRAEVDELTGLLMSNLEKIVQHGRRADSIVKNMLLHSREGGGEHRPSDINALVDESLNLAYHGARAEKPGFNVTLERDFDPTAGQVDLFPQEITRVLLNLVSNGFYAVTQRNKEDGGPGFEPTLRASTKNLGDAVEIRIRDNGTGIPSDVKEKMFNPFFTTKPAGEGTGLGLSMSHDIIAKQHGGIIDVNTEQGHFTEFRIVLPRTSNFTDKSRG
jgi:GAF domain-containing protein